MRIAYTKHADIQIEKRKLEKIWVEEVIKSPDRTERGGINKYYASKKLNGITLEVVYTKERFIKVITVYPLP
ncbi:MAG TPA: DUF4258 domain-containing protein [Candidatus Nanoarchaeia archaeon]|nr:DUF4258 domain-containing protein [Candidatus Nanoarchaeia archaeon]